MAALGGNYLDRAYEDVEMIYSRIVVSEEGKFFDISDLTQHVFDIDQEGYLRIDNCRIAYQSGWEKPGGEWRVVKAREFPIDTVCRVFYENRMVRLHDEYERASGNDLGMRISIHLRSGIPANNIEEEFRAAAERYQELYLELNRG